jgi:signal peptidase I
MLPTSLLADPAIHIAGSRAPSIHRVAKVEAEPKPVPVGRFCVAVLLVALVAAIGYLRTWPPLATVMSASMAPTINTGDIVVLKKLDGPAQIGDIAVVHVPDEARTRYGYPAVVIHRVKAIGADGLVTTQGDARKDPDPFTVPREALSERVVTHLPAAGQVLGFFTSTLGLLWMGGGAVLFFGLPLLERSRQATTEREDRERLLEEALQASIAAQAELAAQLADLPARLERAIAAVPREPAVAAPAEPAAVSAQAEPAISAPVPAPAAVAPESDALPAQPEHAAPTEPVAVAAHAEPAISAPAPVAVAPENVPAPAQAGPATLTTPGQPEHAAAAEPVAVAARIEPAIAAAAPANAPAEAAVAGQGQPAISAPAPAPVAAHSMAQIEPAVAPAVPRPRPAMGLISASARAKCAAPAAAERVRPVVVAVAAPVVFARLVRARAPLAAEAREYVVIPARPVPPVPPVPAPAAPVALRLRAPRARVLAHRPSGAHGALCAVGGPLVHA